jgi:hypothetical protein
VIVCVNLVLLPKTTALIEGVFLRSLWFPIEDGGMNGLLHSVRKGLVIYSVASGLKMVVLIMFAAALARAVLALADYEATLRITGAAATLFVTVLAAKELLGLTIIAMARVENVTMDSLRFRTGASLFLEVDGWTPALTYLSESTDPFGVCSVLLSSAWLRKRTGARWPVALIAMLAPALAALLVGLAVHLALCAKLNRMGAGQV